MRLFRLLICILCGLAPAPAFADMTDDTWQEVRSQNFQILTNGDVGKVKALARDLELFRASVILFTGSRPVSAEIPFRIFALRGQSDIRRFAPERPGRGLRTGGRFASTLRGTYAVIDLSAREYDVRGNLVSGADNVIKHEYVHFILRANSRIRYPFWYEEGFAEYLSTLVYEKGEVRVGFPVVSWHYSLNYGGGRADIEKLLTAERQDKNVNLRVLYGVGWLLVHHLHDDPALARNIVAYLTEYDKTGDSKGSFTKIFQVDLDELNEALKSKAAKGRYSYRRFPLVTPIPEPVIADPVRLSPLDARMALAGVLRLFRRDEAGLAETAAIYEGVLKEYPGNVQAMAALADIDMTRDQLASAEARLAAIPAESADPAVLIARGDALVMKAFAAAETRDKLSTDLLDRARNLYLDALRKDDKLAEAFYSYGLTFVGTPAEEREGVVAMTAASSLVPSSPDLVLYRAIMHLQAGEFEEAVKWSLNAEQALTSAPVRAFAQTVGRLARERDADTGKAVAFAFFKEQMKKKGKEGEDEEEDPEEG